jgi:predicted permease
MVGLPGVRSASLSKTYPAAGWSDRGPIFYEGEDPEIEEMRGRSDRGILAEKNTVSPRYFRTLGIPLMAGREFGPQDTAGAPPVAIVSERLAARLWPGQNALGKRIAVPAYRGPRRPPLEIIGVARDVKYRSLLTDFPLLLYLPLLQNHEVFVSLQVQGQSEPESLAAAVEREVAAVDRNMPLFGMRALSQQVGLSLWQQRASAGLIGLFGMLALLVAAAGLFSVVAHAVAHRTREIGIRMALGAQTRDVLWMVIRDGMMLAVAGVAAGALAALLLSRFVAGFLYGVSPTDPVTFISIAFALLAAALVASYLPARAATRVDPMAALRHE